MLAAVWEILAEFIDIDRETKQFLSPLLFEGKTDELARTLDPLLRKIKSEEEREKICVNIFTCIMEEAKKEIANQQQLGALAGLRAKLQDSFTEPYIDTLSKMHNCKPSAMQYAIKKDWQVFGVRLAVREQRGKRPPQLFLRSGFEAKPGDLLFREPPLLFFRATMQSEGAIGPLKLHQEFLTLNHSQQHTVLHMPALPNCKRKKAIISVLEDAKKLLKDRVSVEIFEQIERVLLVFDYKGIELGDWTTKDEQPIGKCIYRLAAHMAHSCVPNCYIHCVNPEIGLLEVRAIRDIKVGDELTINWLGHESELTTSHLRNKRLIERFGFICRCELCSSPDRFRGLICPTPDCQKEILSRTPFKEWSCKSCGSTFKKSDIRSVLQKEHELGVAKEGLLLTLQSGKKAALNRFERELKEVLQKSMGVLGPCHHTRATLHFLSGEWFDGFQKLQRAAMHIKAYVAIYKDVYGFVPNPKVAKLNYRLGEIETKIKEKKEHFQRACWGFGLCFGAEHACTHKSIALLDSLEKKSCDEEVVLEKARATEV